MGFDWKSLIFVQEEGAKPAEPQKTETKTTFDDHKKPTVTMPSSTTASQSVLTEVATAYERGFDSLNQDGYDFFELYKAVMAVGADNNQAYTMAFAMGKGIKPDLNKAQLVEKGRAYIAELEKVHAGFSQKGMAKKAEINQQLNYENSSLTQNIAQLEKQIAELQSQLNKNKSHLADLQSKFAGPLADIDQRIVANDQAKANLVASLEKVINGINQNL